MNTEHFKFEQLNNFEYHAKIFIYFNLKRVGFIHFSENMPANNQFKGKLFYKTDNDKVFFQNCCENISVNYVY